MKKLLMILGLVVLVLFVVSCAPKEAVEDSDVELVGGEGGAIAGQAISGTCDDPDAVSTYDVAQVFNKSTTVKGTVKWKDQCQTVKGKIILKEGICTTNGKMAVWQYDCSKQNKLAGDKFECVEGACVNKAVQAAPVAETNCADSLDDDNDGNIDCQDTDCSGKTNAKGFVCCKNSQESGCPADTKCDGGSYDGSYQCLGCLANEWDCPTGKECKDSKCIGLNATAPVNTTPAPVNTTPAPVNCTAGAITTTCNGNLLQNKTINPCTEETIILSSEDCSQISGINTSKSCVTFNGTPSCSEFCGSGATVIDCHYNSFYKKYTYYNYTCNNNGIKWAYQNSPSSCPTGQICKLFEGYTNGVCG